MKVVLVIVLLSVWAQVSQAQSSSNIDPQLRILLSNALVENKPVTFEVVMAETPKMREIKSSDLENSLKIQEYKGAFFTTYKSFISALDSKKTEGVKYRVSWLANAFQIFAPAKIALQIIARPEVTYADIPRQLIPAGR